MALALEPQKYYLILLMAILIFVMVRLCLEQTDANEHKTRNNWQQKLLIYSFLVQGPYHQPAAHPIPY